MCFKLILLASLAIMGTLAEAPLNNHAPYAAAGYRPSIPFDLPSEYYPNYDIELEQQLPNQGGISFEIAKQRVDFAGQEIQRIKISEPEKQYLPPSDQLVFINNQVGTGNRQPQNFNHRHNHRHNSRRQNGNRPQRPNTPQTPSNQPPQFLPNFPPVINIPVNNTPVNNIPVNSNPLPKPNTDEKFESQQRPALQYGAPNYNIDPRNNKPASQYGAPYNNHNNNNLGQQQQQQPSQEYGTPNNNYYDSGNFGQQQQPALEYGAPSANSQNYNEEEEQEKQYALDVLNAAVQNYNRLQENNSEKIAQGQYFVVNPDHSIQKVKFTTKKSEDETKQNDFTAELKYTKVGEINDPLYKYTAEGQLVRIVKK